jgi:hypothetical protein
LHEPHRQTHIASTGAVLDALDGAALEFGAQVCEEKRDTEHVSPR